MVYQATTAAAAAAGQCMNCIVSSLVLHDTLKHLEVGGEGLACAARVVDRHGDIPTSCQAERHGHAMVVVCVDRHTSLEMRWWGDDAVVTTLLDL